MPRDQSYPYTCRKMSGQKRSAVAFETNNVPPKKRRVTVKTIHKWVIESDRKMDDG